MIVLESLEEPEADQGLGRVVNFICAGSRKPVYQKRQNPGNRQENGQTESSSLTVIRYQKYRQGLGENQTKGIVHGSQIDWLTMNQLQNIDHARTANMSTMGNNYTRG